MPKRKKLAERQCLYCKKIFMTYANGKSTTKYCSRSCASLDRDPEIDKRAAEKRRKPLVEKVCPQCGKTFFLKPMGQSSIKQKFCSQLCKVRYYYRDPEVRAMHGAKIQERLKEKGVWAWSGKKNPGLAERMRKNNPMHNPEVREVVKRKLKGRTFLSRGGNGKLTKQQISLCQALGLPETAMECSISTTKAKPHFQSLPPAYKVDIGIPDVKLAIEVDGNTHKTKKWKFLDRRKTAVLNFLGWSVLRFWNEEVDQDLERCVQMVMSTISRLKETTTTSPTES